MTRSLSSVGSTIWRYAEAVVALVPKFRFVRDESLEREVAEYRDLTPEERGHLMALACRASERLLRSRSDATEIRSFRDPLPESTERALSRLRAALRR